MRKFDKLFLKDYILIDNPTILDIGCYDGRDSIDLIKIFPQSTIYCFDGDERSLELFKRNVSNENIHLYEIVLSNKDGLVEWYHSTSNSRRHYDDADWSASSSTKKPKNHLSLFKDVDFYKKSELVKSNKLDTFLKENKLSNNKIDLIWADVNGSEGDLLMGSKETLKNTDYIFIEFSDSELYENEPDLKTIKDILFDFELVEIFDFYGNFGNAFFKNKKIKK